MLLFFLISLNSVAQIIINEKFINSSLPSGWTRTIAQGGVNWSFTNTLVMTSTSGGYYAKFNDTEPSLKLNYR